LLPSDLVSTLQTAANTLANSANLRSVIETFIAGAVEPAVLDPGEEPLLLIAEQWDVSEWNGRVVLQAWDRERNLVRKIIGLKEQRRDRLSLLVERFPKAQAELQVADLAAPHGRELERTTSRRAFGERFHLMLSREFPDWRIEEVSSEPNLEQSLSASYTRAFLCQGSTGIAVMGAAPGTASAGVLTFGLIWLDYLRRREKAASAWRLLLFVPLGSEREVVFRAACISPAAIACQVFAFDEKDRAGVIDFADAGNVESTLPPCRRTPSPNVENYVLENQALAAHPDVDRVESPDGSASLQIRGLEFARVAGGKLTCGISKQRRAGVETVAAMAGEIARVRNPDAEDRQHPLYSLNPEGWLESQVRAHPAAIDASLLSAPIYGQVPVFSGVERDVIDLLAIDHKGRLAVIELKATADLQLPFQALDYWLRVRKHLFAGDFERLGYFKGQVISRESPRILLVAPALEFHSTTETVLSALSPGIEVTRIGLAADWRSGLRVMFRLQGAEKPG
jgi:hypothetical protein